MQYFNLGRSGLKVSPICLGTMMFGGQTNEATSKRIVDRARDAGVNFIDTADAYNEGRSEEVTGGAIAAERNAWVLATKVANSMGPGPNGRGLSRKWIMQAAEASLRRGLGRPHRHLLPPQGGSFDAAGGNHKRHSVTSCGKARSVTSGVSNYRSWRVAEICRLCDRGRPRPSRSEPAALQCAQSDARNRAPSRMRVLRAGDRAVFAARARCIDRKIQARRSATR